MCDFYVSKYARKRMQKKKVCSNDTRVWLVVMMMIVCANIKRTLGRFHVLLFLPFYIARFIPTLLHTHSLPLQAVRSLFSFLFLFAYARSRATHTHINCPVRRKSAPVLFPFFLSFFFSHVLAWLHDLMIEYDVKQICYTTTF